MPQRTDQPGGLDRPVLITGTPRSGKTLLGDVLQHAPEFAFFCESKRFWSVVPLGREDDRLDASDATPRLARRIGSRCRKAVAAEGKQRYLDGYAYHALAVPFVNCILPDARFIHVIRDPGDAIPEMIYGWMAKDTVARAIRRRRRTILALKTLPRDAVRFAMNYVQSRVSGRRGSWGPRVPGMKALASAPGTTTAELAAFQWAQMVRIARSDLAALPADRWIEVRFERLLAEPAREIRRLAEFAQIADASALVAQAQRIVEPRRVFEKRVEPTEAQWNAIWARIGDLAAELGYRRSRPAARESHPNTVEGANA